MLRIKKLSEVTNFSDFANIISLEENLEKIGVSSGDNIFVHAAFSKLGPVLGGPDALINAIMNVIGEKGTLVAYSSWDGTYEDFLDDYGRIPSNLKDFIPAFNVIKSRAVRMNGIFPEFLRTTKNAFRSANPGASICAIGKNAEFLCANHKLDYGYGENTPFSKFLELNGKILMIGAPWDTMTILHHSEHLAKIPNKNIRKYEVPIEENGQINWHYIEEFDTLEPISNIFDDGHFEEIVKDFCKNNANSQGKIAKAKSLLVDANDINKFAIEWLENYK